MAGGADGKIRRRAALYPFGNAAGYSAGVVPDTRPLRGRGVVWAFDEKARKSAPLLISNTLAGVSAPALFPVAA
jgi:hypothetical protein